MLLMNLLSPFLTKASEISSTLIILVDKSKYSLALIYVNASVSKAFTYFFLSDSSTYASLRSIYTPLSSPVIICRNNRKYWEFHNGYKVEEKN